jgi:hypothetical protein
MIKNCENLSVLGLIVEGMNCSNYTRNDMAAGYSTDVQVLKIIIFSFQISLASAKMLNKFSNLYYSTTCHTIVLVFHVNFKKKACEQNNFMQFSHQKINRADDNILFLEKFKCVTTRKIIF